MFTINPIALSIGPLNIHWYGIMYAISFVIGYYFIKNSNIGKALKLSVKQIDLLMMFVILGIIIGGRLGYLFFYNSTYYIQNPLESFYIWKGGLSFHGGLVGVIIFLYFFSKYQKISFLKISDVICVIAPIGILLGRIGNFINGELYGRIAEKYCIVFPADPTNCRYPSQLIESFLEGLVLFLILYFYSKKPKKAGEISAYFLILYGIFRTIAENFREPDSQIGFLIGKITMGQTLSFFMIITGIIILFYLKKCYNKKIY